LFAHSDIVPHRKNGQTLPDNNQGLITPLPRQVFAMFVHIAKVTLAPLLYLQARRMHANTVELPEPDGPREGVAGHGPRVVRLLVVGDSSACGVGSPTQDGGLAAHLARALAKRLNAAVHWTVVAETGLTSEGVLRKLNGAPPPRADLAFVVVGVNDITKEVPLRHALRQRTKIVAWLRRRAGVRQVVLPGLPEMQRFPSIPQPLAWYAGLHARRNNRAQARWARKYDCIHHASIDGVMRAELMASDGYHPSPPLYGIMAEHLAEFAARIKIAS
jgi:lysophospholipase L1-like esterase